MSEHAQVLMLNFTEADAERVRKAGFTVDLGFAKDSSSGNGFSTPHPVYEYDVYIYNSVTAKEIDSVYFPDHRTSSQLTNLHAPPRIRVAFTGKVPQHTRELIGTDQIKTTSAHSNISTVLAVGGGGQAIKKLDQLIAQNVGGLALPVAQQLTATDEARTHPFNFNPVLVNRNGDVLGCYSSSYNRVVPHYLILPQFKNNVEIAIKLLLHFAEAAPNMFPTLSAEGWENSSEFWNQDEKRIQDEIAKKELEHQAFLKEKEEQFLSAAGSMSFIKGVITALETSTMPTEDRLSTQVRLTLEYLGFIVTDIDAQISSVIRKEDFWVQDGDFFAITEVNGTQKKNPKRTEFNDLVGRMMTIFKRHDLVPDSSKLSGLLILNYDAKTHPDRRPTLYSGEDADIGSAAKGAQIGILSTVELYKLAREVMFERMTKDEARFRIKEFGLLTAFPPKDKAAAKAST